MMMTDDIGEMDTSTVVHSVVSQHNTMQFALETMSNVKVVVSQSRTWEISGGVGSGRWVRVV